MANVLNLAICDDDKSIQEILRDKIAAYSIARNLDCRVSVFSNGDEMRGKLPAETDVLFLDVEMPGEDGMTAAKRLREVNDRIVIIFLSAYNQYVFESFKVNTFRYLLKPLQDEEFTDTMDAVLRKLFTNEEKLVFHFQRETYAVDFSSIIYIEVMSGKVWIYTTGKTYRWSGSPSEYSCNSKSQQTFAITYFLCKLTGDPVATLSGEELTAKDLADGYYLIVDDTTKTIPDGDAFSRYIVQVVGDITIDPKKSTTSSDKKITGDTDKHASKDGKKDNIDIGDTVNYQITANVADNANEYDYYYFILSDTMSKGLTFQENTVAVKASGKDLKIDEDYAVYTTENQDGTTSFQVALLTDLDKLVEGDCFLLQVLGKTLTYEVDQIRIVLPDEMKDLAIEEGKDYCTLVTCTPYGVNSHRMLVRGHRIENRHGSRRMAEDVQERFRECIFLYTVVLPFWKKQKRRNQKGE